jgi:hypothetical protein
MKRLDRHTVKAVELTAPGACERDADRLHHEIRKGHIFGAFTVAERETIWEELRTVSVDRLVPSLFSFFEDVRYLRGPAARMRRLICGSGIDYAPRTLRQSFSGENQTDNTCIFQVSESQLEARSGCREDQVELGIRQMWMSAMRGNVLSRLAVLAHRLGFKTRPIQDSVQCAAAQVVSSAYKVSHTDQSPKRCGIPRAHDQLRDKELLFADALHGDLSPHAGITSFFVCRSVYLAFFGLPPRTGAAGDVLYRVSLEEAEPAEETEQMDGTEQPELHTQQVKRAERAAQEALDREQMQQEKQEYQAREQSRLMQLARDLGEERKKLDELASSLGARKIANDCKEKENEKTQLAWDQRERSLHTQQDQCHVIWNQQRQEDEQKLDTQRHQQDQREQKLTLQEAAIRSQEDKLKQDQLALEEQQQKQAQRERELTALETTIRSQEDKLKQERMALDVRKQAQDQWDQKLNTQKATNQSKQDELDQEQLALHLQKQKLLAEQQELRLAQKSKERRAEGLLHSTQDPQPPLQHPEHESKRPPKGGGELVPVQPPKQYSPGPIRPGTVRPRQESSMVPERPGKVNGQRSEESGATPPTRKPATVATQGDIQMDDWRITQIGVQSSDGSKPSAENTVTRLKRRYQKPEEHEPEPEQQDSAHGDWGRKKPRLLEGSEQEGQETPAMARQLTNQSKANREPSEETKGIGERREDEVSSTSVRKGKRTTQIVLTQSSSAPQDFAGPAQRDRVKADQSQRQRYGGDSVATTSDHEPATSPMRVVFNKLHGKTLKFDQEVLVGLEDPNPVREVVVEYQRQGFEFYDSQDRILSLETCLEDIAQDKIRTIFLRPRQPPAVLGKRR